MDVGNSSTRSACFFVLSHRNLRTTLQGHPAPATTVLTMMPEKKHYSYTNLADTPQVSGNGVVLTVVLDVFECSSLAASSDRLEWCLLQKSGRSDT